MQKNVAGALYSQYRNVMQTRRVRRQFENVHIVVGVQRAEVNQSSSGKELKESCLCVFVCAVVATVSSCVRQIPHHRSSSEREHQTTWHLTSR